MVTDQHREERLRREAAQWVARLQGGRTPALEQDLAAWCNADPAHRAAFERVQRSFQAAAVLRHSDVGRARTLRWQGVKKQRLAIAASLAVVAVGGTVLLVPHLASTPAQALMLSTTEGEVRRVRLPDGSDVLLDRSSRLQVHLSATRRRAQLEQGRARITIAAEERPFELAAGKVRVEVQQGAVEAAAVGAGTIEVISGGGGAAASEGDQDRVPIRAGQQVSIGPEGRATVATVPAPARWPEGVLEFKGAPLAAVAAEANRFASDSPIRVAPETAQVKVTGVFRPGDNRALAQSLAAALGLEVRLQPDGSLLLEQGRK